MRITITRNQFDAVLFDLDGVITDTANLHAASWKQMFDEYLKKRAAEKAEAFFPFDIARDYQLYVDGKSRFAGVRDFLASRNIYRPKEIPTVPHRPKQSVASAIERTHLSTKSLKKKGWSPIKEASGLSISSAIRGSRSQSSPRVRTATLS